MAKYIVKAGRQVNSGHGIFVQAGEEIELDEKEAAGLLENGTVEAKAAPAQKAPVSKPDDKGR